MLREAHPLGANMKTKLSDDLTLDDVDEAMLTMIASRWNLLHKPTGGVKHIQLVFPDRNYLLLLA